MQNMADNNWLCVNSNNRVVSSSHTFVLCILTADCKLYSQEYQKMDVKNFMVFWECDKNFSIVLRFRKFTSDAVKIDPSQWAKWEFLTQNDSKVWKNKVKDILKMVIGVRNFHQM